jgi:tRNA (adenine37-N6)-methyltransferase
MVDMLGDEAVTPMGLVPIGRASTPWRRGDCPKNMRAARETGQSARVVIGPTYRAGLTGLERASHLILLGWFGDVDRNVLVQQPKHLARPHGCFSLRTPARPNPIGLSIVRQVSFDALAGRIEIDALDWFDGTLVLDLKPYYPSTDMLPGAEVRDL